VSYFLRGGTEACHATSRELQEMVKSAERGSLSSALLTPVKAPSAGEEHERGRVSRDDAAHIEERLANARLLGPSGEEIARRVAEELRLADNILFNKGTASADALRPSYCSYERADDPTTPPKIEDAQHPPEVAGSAQLAPASPRGARRLWWLGVAACGCLALILSAAILALSMSRPVDEGPAIATPRAAEDDNSQDRPVASNQDTASLVVRGDTFLGTGDIASARLYYQQAADAGNARAAMFLGLTFDPAFLERTNARGMHGDVAQAEIWYRRARDLGEPEAVRLLASLDSK
jgi:hypothetical protein